MSSIVPKNYSVQEAKADQTYSKSGKGIAEGKKTNRLILGNDSRLNIAVAEKLNSNPISGFFNRIYTNLRHVKLKVGDKNIYVNVNSLAKRLHLSKSDIRAAAQEGKLDQLIEAKTPHLSRILDEYRDLFVSYKHERGLKRETGLSTETLMKTVTVAMSELSKSKSEFFIEAKHSFIARLDDKAHLQLAFIAKQLGAGGSGTVSKIIELSSIHKREDSSGKVINDGRQSEAAIKFAHYGSNAKKDVENEFMMLNHLHSPGPNDPPPPPSIQAKPHKFIKITSHSEEKFGFQGEIYQVNLLKAFKEPIGKKLQRGLSMMEGIAYLHARGIAHKDIKAENFLIKGNTTVVSDFGGTKFLADFEKDSKFDFGKHTIIFANPNLLEKAYNDFNTKNFQGMKESILQNDAFSLAATLYELFTGDLPYKTETFINGFQYPTPKRFTNAQIKNLKSHGVPKDIIKLLDEMISGPVPTMSDAFDRYKAAYNSIKK